jgi:hypothetical protein
MSDVGTVGIDPARARALAAGILAGVDEVRLVATATLYHGRAAHLDDSVRSARRLMIETAGELALVGVLLDAVAARAEGADLSFSAIVAGARSAQFQAAIWASQFDGDGAHPADFDDPKLAYDDAYPSGHFGFLPVFGPEGPQLDDVEQGRLGDCWLMAGLAATALTDPESLRRLITDHGNGTYTVHFPDGDVTIDDELPFRLTDDGPRLLYARDTGDQVLWPSLVEKAAAMRAGGDYDAIDGIGFGESAFEPFTDSTTFVFGVREPLVDARPDLVAEVEAHLEQGLPVVANSFAAFGMGGGHSWTVVDVNGSGSAATVVVRNPWGRLGMRRNDAGQVVYDTDGDGNDDDEDRVRFAEDDDADAIEIDDPNDPTIELPLDVFADNFQQVEFVEGWPADPSPPAADRPR